MNMNKYSIILADPPWQFTNKRTGGSMTSGAASKYSTMPVADLMHMPIDDLAAEDCVLFMWWCGSMPEQALSVVDAWGFKLKTMTGFVWSKLTVNEKPFFGMGFQTRQDTECCLIATRGKIKRQCASVRSGFRAIASGHSRKPDIHSRIVRLYGDLPRVELFARENVPGWSAWGNQVPNSIDWKF